MASATKRTYLRKKRKQSSQGKRRKRKEQNQGTTPRFPIHSES